MKNGSSVVFFDEALKAMHEAAKIAFEEGVSAFAGKAVTEAQVDELWKATGSYSGLEEAFAEIGLTMPE